MTNVTGLQSRLDEAEQRADLLQQIIDKCRADYARLAEALEHIAAGNISPAMAFAANVLAGMSALEAHRKALEEDNRC